MINPEALLISDGSDWSVYPRSITYKFTWNRKISRKVQIIALNEGTYEIGGGGVVIVFEFIQKELRNIDRSFDKSGLFVVMLVS